MIAWVFETLAASTLLMLLVLALRRPVAAAFGARVTYALWLLPALRMVLPALPGWIRPWLAVPQAPLMATMAPDAVAGTSFAVQAGPVPTLADQLAVLLPLLALVWAAGGMAWFGWQMLRYHRFVAAALDKAAPLPPLGRIAVFASAGVAGPLAAGVRNRRIFLPADFATRYTANERRLALAHEHTHHIRGDLVANLVGLAVLALHWWNPVAHWAWRAFRADQELACDATVLAGAAPEHRLAYGRAVLKSACGATPAAACAMNHKNQLKQRIVMMKVPPFGAARLFAGAVSSLAFVAGGLLLTASGTAAAPAALAAPAAPVAPESRAAPVSPAAPAQPVSPRIIIIKDGAISIDGKIKADDLHAPEGTPSGKGGKQIKTIIMTHTEPGTAAPAGGKRVVVRCIKTARIENGKTVVTDASKDCAIADMPDINAITAEAMQEAGVQIALIRPTIEHALQSARVAIEENRDLSADQRAKALAGLDIAMKETLKDKSPAK